jgi:SAM-dependent MidA family methyltransferase
MLRDVIRAEIAAAGGRITFARYMELALYHPEFGYYTTAARSENAPDQHPVGRAVPARRPRIGKTGDYFTSVSTGPVFGRILARQFEKWGATEITEFGGHRGQLQDDILAAAPHLNYRIIETGDPLPEQLTGVVFSNEFLDALPVHRICGDREVYVETSSPSPCPSPPKNGGEGNPDLIPSPPAGGEGWGEGDFREVLGPLSDPHLPRLPDGYRSEINLRALDWLTDISHRLDNGYILTIDYGFTRQEYFAPHRRDGHLQCYYRHTKNSDPYQHIGEQDITAHVEFTSLIEHGERLGLETVLFTDQAHFLLEAGKEVIEEIVARDAGKPSRDRNSIHQLLHSTMGRAFKVLVQRKN